MHLLQAYSLLTASMLGGVSRNGSHKVIANSYVAISAIKDSHYGGLVLCPVFNLFVKKQQDINRSCLERTANDCHLMCQKFGQTLHGVATG